MCGRFALGIPKKRLEEHFGAPFPDEEPRMNIAPSQNVLAVVVHDGERRVERLHWGLIPFWAKDEKIGYKTINARAETAHSKPAFREAFKRRRCLIPASGFYEWEKAKSGKIPHLFTLSDGEPMALAGLWETWRPEDGPEVRSCTILTTEANALVATFHDRMPVILQPSAYEAWLAPDTPREDLTALLAPLPANLMDEEAADPRLNSPGWEPQV